MVIKGKGGIELASVIDPSDMTMIDKMLLLIKDKYGLEGDIEIKLKKSSDAVPVCIFSKKLGVTESLIKYLKENRKMTNHEISLILHKQENNITVTYSKAKKKMPEGFAISDSEEIPIKIFKSNKSCLKKMIIYLRENKGMSFAAIGRMIGRSQKTIWATYKREDE